MCFPGKGFCPTGVITMSALARRIHGPIVSCADLAAHEQVFEAFGLKPAARASHSAAETLRRFGVVAQSAEEVFLETPQTPYGVTLLRLDPPSDVTIRDPQTGYDADALKVIDFYAPDFDRALQHLREHGIDVLDEIADYEFQGVRFREAHFWGPDAVVCAVIWGEERFFKDFATVRDRMFSEPQSISGSVSVQAPVVSFLERVFGLSIVFRYGVAAEDFQSLVGGEGDFNLSAINMGLSTAEPYFGLIHYGMAPASFASLKARSRLPHRGLVGATLTVTDADECAVRAAEAGAEMLAPVGDFDIPGFGRCRQTLFRGPNGASFRALQLL